MSDDRDVAAIATLLADECTRTILTATTTEPMSADALSERCDVSTQTIYRRLNELGEHDLIAERLRVDADGHHYKVYSATLDRVAISLTDEGFDCRLTRRERMADRFTQFVKEM